jgi:Flp pilus assembly protein TadD
VGTRKLDTGELTGALDDFRRATAALETYAPAHYQMGRALKRLGQAEAADAAFARAQQLNPNLVRPPYSP